MGLYVLMCHIIQFECMKGVCVSGFRSERERARLEHLNLRSKLFVYEEDSESNIPFSINPMFNQVCQAVNGFIFVVNAETERGMNVLDCPEHTLD